MAKKGTTTPRFVLSITDTQTILDGPQGKQTLNIGIGADSLNDFMKFIPKSKRKEDNPGRTEFEAMMFWFAGQVNELNKKKPAGEIKFTDQGKAQEED